MHEVAYGTLARRDRRIRHLAAARYIDSLGDDAMATVVAAHYLEAYRAAPDDEQGRVIRAQARVALRAAADRSARLHNYGQAVRDLERSLELTDDAAERAGILVQQAELNEAAVHFDEAAVTAELARDAYEALGSTVAALQATALMGRIEMKRSRPIEAAVLLEHALAGLDPTSGSATYARLAAEFARTHMMADRNAEGAAWAERALVAAGPIRRIETIAEAMNTKGVCLQGLGRLDEGIALIRASVDLAATHHLSAAELRARFNLSGRLDYDDPTSAIEVLRAGIEVARRTGRGDWLMLLSHFLATTLTAYGLDYDEAIAVLDSVEDVDRAPEQHAGSMVERAKIQAYRGDATAWPRIYPQAQAMIKGSSNTQVSWDFATSETWVAFAEGRLADAARASMAIGGNWAGWGAFARARAAIRSGDLVAARDALAERELKDEIGAIWDMLRIGIEAGIAALDGRRDEAIGGYREAVRRARQFRTLGTAADLLLDAVYALPPGDPERTAFADEARALYAPAGAQAHLDRLDEAMARQPSVPHRSPEPVADGATLTTGPGH